MQTEIVKLKATNVVITRERMNLSTIYVRIDVYDGDKIIRCTAVARRGDVVLTKGRSRKKSRAVKR